MTVQDYVAILEQATRAKAITPQQATLLVNALPYHCSAESFIAQMEQAAEKRR